MAEEQPTTKKTKKRPAPQPEVFHIHNLTRSVSTRLQRAKAAQRPRFKQLLGGGIVRLVRGRPVPITKPMVERLLLELIQKEKEGILKVTTPDGRLVDLSTLKPLEDKKVAPPKPEPPLDSAANDETFEHGVGNAVPQVPGGLPQGATPPLPEALKGIPEGVAAVPEGKEPEPPVEEDLESVAQAVYDNWSKRELEGLAEEYGVEDLTGNKMDLAKRLVEAGLRLEV
jgi:hypothetical protein